MYLLIYTLKSTIHVGKYTSSSHGSYRIYNTTVDGTNPAPVDMVNNPLFAGFHTCKVVQDFFHQQYH